MDTATSFTLTAGVLLALYVLPSDVLPPVVRSVWAATQEHVCGVGPATAATALLHWPVLVATLLLIAAAAIAQMERKWRPAPVPTAEELYAAGLGPVDTQANAHTQTAASGGAKPSRRRLSDARASAATGVHAALDAAPLTSAPLSGAARLYLDLTRRVLVNVPYMESTPAMAIMDESHELRAANRFDLRARLEGQDFAANVLTMTGWRRISFLQAAIEHVLAERVPGDFIELGAFRGGSAIFMRACLKALEECGVDTADARRVYVADVFNEEPEDTGRFSPWWSFFVLFIVRAATALAYIPIPAWRRWYARVLMKPFGIVHDPHASDDTFQFIINGVRGAENMGAMQHYIPMIRGGYERVRSHFARFGLLDDRVKFVKGWFAEAVPKADFRRLSLLRLDGDFYASTRDALETCYAALSVGGIVIVDDYYAFADCKRAVDEFRAKRGITAPMVRVDSLCTYWIKEAHEEVRNGPRNIEPR